MRTVAVAGHRFLINGEPFRFTGFGKHEDFAVRGRGHDVITKISSAASIRQRIPNGRLIRTGD